MMREGKRLQAAIVTACILILSSVAVAQSADVLEDAQPGSLFERGERGWFWYEDPPVEEELEEVELSPPDPVPPPPPPPEMARTPSPPPLSAAWIRENISALKDKAIDNPTRENILAYLYVQKVAMDKAENFGRAYKTALTSDPILNEAGKLSSASFRGDRIKKADSIRKTIFDRLVDQMGLFFFYDKDCADCGVQSGILANLRRLYGVHVTAISLDGSIADASLFDDLLIDEGQAAQMGVKQAPAIVAAIPPDKYSILVQGGGMMRSELIELYLAAGHRAGLVTESEIDATRTVYRKNTLPLVDFDELNPDVFNDPRKTVEYLQTLYR